jgi:hypothetical protein
MKVEIPDEDLCVAEQNGCVFRVTKRGRPGTKWLTVADAINGLDDAFAVLERTESSAETCVWRILPGGGSIQYWKSEAADVFNSNVLRL